MTQTDLPAVDIITVNFNGKDFLADYFRSLAGLRYPKEKIRLFFADNGSRDGSLDFVRGVKTDYRLEIVDGKRNLGFARANNLVFKRCTAEYIALLNNDTRVDPEWLSNLIQKIQSDPSIGIVSSRQIPQESSRYIDPVTNQTSWCSGGHCVIRKDVLEKTGFFDEKFFMYGEDVDLSWRIWLANFSCVYVPEAVCEHHHRQGGYNHRRYFYHVRNSILLRYKYGTLREGIRCACAWFKEGLHRLLIRGRPGEAAAILKAAIAHLGLAAYFRRQHRIIAASPRYADVRKKWIAL